MIENDAGLQQSIEQVERIYRVLASLHARVAPLNYANYQVLAEGPIDEIRRLQRDIDAYLGIPSEVAAGQDAM